MLGSQLLSWYYKLQVCENQLKITNGTKHVFFEFYLNLTVENMATLKFQSITFSQTIVNLVHFSFVEHKQLVL